MKRIVLFLVSFLCTKQLIIAQDTKSSCKVLMANLMGSYDGECKDGLANGKGVAKGVYKYDGIFKNGMPNGKGTYFLGDSIYYAGSFQDGLKEGKGEMHYMLAGKADSIIKGYWSGDVYRGKTYKTYYFDAESRFDRVEVEPSSQTGNTLTFETSSTTGSPNGSTSGLSDLSTNYVFYLTDLVSLTPDSFIDYQSNYSGSIKKSLTVHISKFPVTLRGTLSNGIIFNLELYKAANWKMRLFINK